MRVRVIVNPIAGHRGRRSTNGAARRDLAHAVVSAYAAVADVVLTAAPGHAVELARRAVADRIDRVVAWGGDGTINEVAGPLIGSDTILGVIPGGSGDGFARGLKIPADPETALARALAATAIRLDVGWMGERHFLNAAGVGFDAAVAEAFRRRPRRGLSGYLIAGFGSACTYRCVTYTLEFDGIQTTAPQFLVAFANGPQYGNGFVLAPGADPTDGWLDAVVVDKASTLRQLWRARRLLLAPDKPQPGLRRKKIKHARISCGGTLVAHVDGEPFLAPSPLVVRVQPAALAVAAGPMAAEG